ncbi:hypothetical protein EJB05_56810, partial [Eragrostis curvula]
AKFGCKEDTERALFRSAGGRGGWRRIPLECGGRGGGGGGGGAFPFHLSGAGLQGKRSKRQCGTFTSLVSKPAGREAAAPARPFTSLVSGAAREAAEAARSRSSLVCGTQGKRRQRLRCGGTGGGRTVRPSDTCFKISMGCGRAGQDMERFPFDVDEASAGSFGKLMTSVDGFYADRAILTYRGVPLTHKVPGWFSIMLKQHTGSFELAIYAMNGYLAAIREEGENLYLGFTSRILKV